METCIFCKIVSNGIPSYKVYEDDTVLAFLDVKPVSTGHTLVIPKKHFANLYELPDETLSKLSFAVRDLSIKIKKALSADGINIEMNNDTSAGQIIFHAHTHIIPRFKDDGLRHWPGQDITQKKMNEILEKIKSS